MLGHYARDRLENEPFGDFVIRAGYVKEVKAGRDFNRSEVENRGHEGQQAPQTIAAANGVGQDAAFGAVAPPIYLASSYKFGGFERPGAYDYSRPAIRRAISLPTRSPSWRAARGLVVASGMAAIDLVLSRLEPGERVVAPHDCYGGTYRLLNVRAGKGQFEVVFIDQNDAAALDAALAAGQPKLVLIETPSNPLMRVVDIAAIARKAKAAGAAVAVDNTFLSPALQQPIALGADFVIHSTTKYLNGHSDIVGGAVIAAEADDAAALAAWANVTGVTGSPFDA